jgi:hypothetical protein
MEYKLEVVLIPVSDVDRAKSFYVDQCGVQPGRRSCAERRLSRGADHATRLSLLADVRQRPDRRGARLLSWHPPDCERRRARATSSRTVASR